MRFTDLIEACKCNDMATFRLYMAENPDACEWALCVVTRNNRPEMVRALFEEFGCPVASVKHCFYSTLREEHFDIARIFVSKGFNVNTETLDWPYGPCTSATATTPLIVAAEGGMLSAVKFLIEECNVDAENQKDHRGLDAFHVALSRDRLPIVLYFIERFGMDPTRIGPKSGKNLLMVACRFNARQVVSYLLANWYFDVNAQSKSGKTILQYATKDAVRELVEAYANLLQPQSQ